MQFLSLRPEHRATRKDAKLNGEAGVTLQNCPFPLDLLVQSLENCLFFLGPHSRHMEVPRLGVESELQLLAYTTATATRDLTHIWDLHHNSRPRPNP